MLILFELHGTPMEINLLQLQSRGTQFHPSARASAANQRCSTVSVQVLRPEREYHWLAPLPDVDIIQIQARLSWTGLQRRDQAPLPSTKSGMLGKARDGDVYYAELNPRRFEGGAAFGIYKIVRVDDLERRSHWDWSQMEAWMRENQDEGWSEMEAWMREKQDESTTYVEAPGEGASAMGEALVGQ